MKKNVIMVLISCFISDYSCCLAKQSELKKTKILGMKVFI